MLHSNSNFLLRLSLLVGLLLCLSGCQQGSANKLLGRWEGRPDSAAARAAREAEKYGDAAVGEAAESQSTDESSAAEPVESVQITDWESYDVTIFMNFVSKDWVEMSLGADQQKRAGHWQVIATTPAGCTIEIQTEDETKTGSEAGKEPQKVRRRFDLIFDERDEVCVGFTLSESGADRQLGTLYFRRADSSDATLSN